MGTTSVVLFLFLCVCGGGYGIEPIISAGYPFYALLGFFFLPWLIAFPQGLVVSELTAAIPESGGYVLWVQKSLGNYWGFLKGILDYITAVSCNCVYLYMFTDYLYKLTGDLGPITTLFLRIILLIAIIGLCSFGVDVFDKILKIYSFLIMLPFLVLFLFSYTSLGNISEIATQFYVKKDTNEINFPVYLTIILWSNCGYDLVASVSPSIVNPSKTVPKALFLSIVLINIFYILILGAGILHDQDYKSWDDGTFILISEHAQIPYLEFLMSFSAMFSAVGMLNTHLISGSISLSILSQKNFLNLEFLRKEDPNPSPSATTGHGDPHLVSFKSLVVNSVTSLGLCYMLGSFTELVELEMVFFSGIVVLEYAALFWFRKYKPDMNRPYKIPLNTKGLICFVGPHLLICVGIIAFANLRVKFWAALILTFASLFYVNRNAKVNKALGKDKISASV